MTLARRAGRRASAAGAARLRLGIDASCWSNRRGFGRFTRGLVTEVSSRAGVRGHGIVLLGDASTLADPSLPLGPERWIVDVPAPTQEASAGGGRRLRDMAKMSLGAHRARADVWYFPATYSYVPVLGAPVVVTVHDTIAERLPHLVVPSRADRWRWTAKQRLALAQAAAVVTVSNASHAEVAQILRVPVDRLHVIHEAPDVRFSPSLDEPAPASTYILYVGGISPHKNLTTLVAAFDLVLAGHPDTALVIAGDTHEDPFLSATEEVRSAIDHMTHAGRVEMLGFVPDDELVTLYRWATATVQCSLAEGFGLTAAESVACGTPVVASDLPVLRELLGDAGTFVDPRDPRAIAAAIGRLLAEPDHRQALAARGLARAASWSWAGAADTVLDLLESVAAR